MPIVVLGPLIPAGLAGSLTLARIEQTLAPRVGPYQMRTHSNVLHGTTALAFFDALKSNSNPGGVENLYLLRRGVLLSGLPVPGFVADDRQRLAATYDPLQGSVAPDRPWNVAPADTELFEFHHLDPELELRPAVQAGLRRCYFEDRVSVTLTGTAAERDLTAVLFWITRPSQVRRVQFASTGSTWLPSDQRWWQPYSSGGHVWLAGWRDMYPDNLIVTALRPHSSWVNGLDSTTGPLLDADLLSVDLNYAVAAAHAEAWRMCKPKLHDAASAGLQDSQKEVAEELTKAAVQNINRKRREYSLAAPFGLAR